MEHLDRTAGLCRRGSQQKRCPKNKCNTAIEHIHGILQLSKFAYFANISGTYQKTG
jgi:hypothetical protein